MDTTKLLCNHIVTAVNALAPLRWGDPPGGRMTTVGTRRDTRVRTRVVVPTCDGCGAPASWRGEVEGVTCDLCSACRKAGVVP